MQVARLLEPRERRNLGAKMRQIVRALELERALGKDGVLALYLTLAPYGGNLEGVRAASLAYFGKEPRKLSLAESRAAGRLAAISGTAPARSFPDRGTVQHAIVCSIGLRWLGSCHAMKWRVQNPTRSRASASRCRYWHRTRRTRWSCWSPIAANTASPLRSIPAKNLQELAHERAQALGPDISVAILAVDNASGEARARVASADYFDARRAGQVDMTQALRSPGSTLKPFIYGLGFEDGVIHPRHAHR